MRVLLTGATGFVGRHVARDLSNAGHEVVGVGHSEEFLGHTSADHVQADLTQEWPDLSDFEAVVHLAALSAVGPSFEEPQRYIETNSAMVTLLGETVLKHRLTCRVLLVSTGAVYDPNQQMPLAEDARLGHSSPYAVSKLLTEAQAAYYQARGARWMVVRPFNHLGPGQGPGFILPDLYEGLVSARQQGRSLPVGNLATRRDYTDVRDVARAYRLLLECPDWTSPMVNVCSGHSFSGYDLLGILQSLGIGSGIPVIEDPARKRPNDPELITGDNDLLRRLTGWDPEFTLEHTVRDFVEWRLGVDGASAETNPNV